MMGSTEQAGAKSAVHVAHLVRPIQMSSVTPGEQVNGIGWLDQTVPARTMWIEQNGVTIAPALLGIQTPDIRMVAAVDIPNGMTGFVFSFAVPLLPAGPAAFRLVAAGPFGAWAMEFILVITEAGSNTQAALVGAAASGRLDASDSAKIECEEISFSSTGMIVVKGWALAASGDTEIEIELNGQILGTVRPQYERPDVSRAFPHFTDVLKVGYRFEANLDGRFVGQHAVRLTVRGRDGESCSILQPITVSQVDIPARSPLVLEDDAAIRFYLDEPACRDGLANSQHNGFLTLAGWAFGHEPIRRIEVFVDGISRGMAHHGRRREDVKEAFPGFDNLDCGFTMLLSPDQIKPGLRDIRIDFADRVGRTATTSLQVRVEAFERTAGPWHLRRKLSQAEINLQLAIAATAGRQIHFTIVTILPAATQGSMAALAESFASLRWQAYSNWRLVLVACNDTDALLFSEIVANAHGHLSQRTQCLALSGPVEKIDYLVEDMAVFLAPGDRLGEDALLELAVALAQQPSCDFIYPDERRHDPADGVEKAFFKPEFSPNLLLSTNYIGRCFAASAALLARADINVEDWRARGPYEIVLRLTEQAHAVHRIARVLVARGGAKETQTREKSALQRAILRRRIDGTLQNGAVRGSWRLSYTVPPAATGLVSIIIPTAARGGLIKTAIQSIRRLTAWPNYEIIVLDNIPADAPEKLRAWKPWIAESADKVIACNEPFNWSRFNNIAAREACGDYLLFLNDDIEVTNANWLHALVEHAQRAEVGAVGPQLVYPDGRVQHAGMFLANHVGRHAFRHSAPDAPGPFGLALTQREVISVTGACLMTRRDIFKRIGGFNEAHNVINNDLDFNLRLYRAGLAVIYTPATSLIHHEKVSRSELPDSFDSEQFWADWHDVLSNGDPYFNPNLSRNDDNYSLETEPVRQFVAGTPLFERASLRRILAVKLDHIGDFITALPALRRLKACFPNAELTVLAATASLAIAHLEPAIDRVIEYNFFHPRSDKGLRRASRQSLAELKSLLGGLEFDLAIDLRRQSDTRPILLQTGARWLAGFDMDYGQGFLDIAVEFEGDLPQQRKRSHVGDALLALVEAVATACGDEGKPVVVPFARDASLEIFAQLAGKARATDRPLVCVHCGAGAVNKLWSDRSFATLIDMLYRHANAEVFLVGGPDETAFAGSVLRQALTGGQVINLIGKTTLQDLPTLLRAADLFVGNDSGPKHIAAAIGVPTIGIHSGAVDAGEWGAVGARALTISRETVCSPCYLSKLSSCHRNQACLTGIGVGDVFAACQRMLILAGKHP